MKTDGIQQGGAKLLTILNIYLKKKSLLCDASKNLKYGTSIHLGCYRGYIVTK